MLSLKSSLRRTNLWVSIMTYILREFHFHRSGIDCSHGILTKLKTLFNKINEGEVMHIEKELISLELISFDMIEDYLSRIKEIQLK